MGGRGDLRGLKSGTWKNFGVSFMRESLMGGVSEREGGDPGKQFEKSAPGKSDTKKLDLEKYSVEEGLRGFS